MSLLDSYSDVSVSSPRYRKYLALVHEDLTAIYSRDLHKWLLLAPLIGVVTGILITGVVLVILDFLWAYLLPFFYAHHLLIVPLTTLGFLLTGLIMQFLTPNPNLHSTEEIIASYHEHQGDINFRPFWFKLLAAATTIGFGGSAALEGPSIYGGGTIGSWLWGRVRGFKLTEGDRRVMLISGAAAGMAAVFRAPLTGLIFALEMPYRDDLAHEALLPSLIASVVSYATLVALLGSEPLFGFIGASRFSERDLFWSALLGVVCGLVAMVFATTFRRFRSFAVKLAVPHTLKMVAGGFATGLCGLAFVTFYPGVSLMPLGPNYEAVKDILSTSHPSHCLLVFGALKGAATLFSLGVGGVSAMFVPLLLMGGSIGKIFGQSIVHVSGVDLYAAVGMASFIAAAYKTPLAAVIFVAETTGGLAFLIPTLIGSAVAYAVSGEASVSADQRLHEVVKLSGPTGIKARQIMQTHIVGVQADATVRDFFNSVANTNRHQVYPVFSGKETVGLLSLWEISQVPADRWEQTRVGEVARKELTRIGEDADLGEVVRLLTRQQRDRLLVVVGADGIPVGIITDSDVLQALEPRGGHGEK
ncbi:MAG TPA: chloride channel protein [Candidatus Binataceae bacterium]|nr:chloride channel protein [Candidatus Binataceae bacterium]